VTASPGLSPGVSPGNSPGLSRDQLEAVLSVTHRLADAFDLPVLLAEITHAAMRVLRAERCSVWLLSPEADELVMHVSDDAPAVRVPISQGLVGACARERRAIHVADCYADPRFDPGVDRLTGFHTRCSLTLPLIDHLDVLIGVVQVLNPARADFDESDALLARALSAQCAIALTRSRLTTQALEAERMREGLALARTMQASTLPKVLPTVAGYELHTHFQPADQTGGDTFELAPVGSQVLVMLADAAGHGIGPALSVMQLHAMVRVAFRMSDDLSTVFRQVNDQLHDMLPDGHFITAFIGLLDPATHRLRFLSGGQAPILHVRAAQCDVISLGATSFPMGAMPIERLRPPVELTLLPGDLLVLLSDGIYEAESSTGELFGRKRVQGIVQAGGSKPLPDIAVQLLEGVNAHTEGAPQGDDITMVLLRHESDTFLE
jgi:phosphoserine phosphatase